jgi:hypothetical protein
MLSRGSGGGSDCNDEDQTDADCDNANGDAIDPDNGNGRPPRSALCASFDRIRDLY